MIIAAVLVGKTTTSGNNYLLLPVATKGKK
jgi:hypothetical protein